ncbi:DUF4364 family protein [Clostridium septicum]|uniref:DUF4364 domain-containing protein n=1 Tax=Clostridium septicum TaxID=1504 RepID=A0A9N7JNQ6_CLOSE|nr:DUF4364 family protein [Clostridium septicum]AYE35539.1 DUF4364 domain-containing protein [Clostridium septicum]MDU1315367.1 DUF4364 family protein [Clostridium septicum]QAS60926.1 DUF4364 family protein [Clostridium septicum]UEC19800.1 DUF4364 family protein [Clostridium septicum]USS02141.1 DUF4364 family protein [Clostridium septicum]
MYENSTELAENKLLVLYVIKSLKQPITNTQLTEIILENNFINYFTLQQYISELISSEFLKYVLVNDKNLIDITEKGINVLSFFTDRISPIKKKIIDDYLLTIIDSIKKELTIHSDYTLGKNDSFLVDLQALEDESLLMELKVSVPSKKQAVSLCNRWKENPSEIYTKIINTLFTDED